jgi:hypothetical protein
MLTKHKLMNAAGENGGGGGDDLDAKIAAALEKALPKALNGVVTSHLKRVMAPIEERFAKLEKPPAAGEGEDGDEAGGEPPAAPKGKGGSGSLPPEVEQRIIRAEKRAEKLEREVKEEREKRAAEERTRMTQEERSALSKVLGEKKVSPEMLDVAVALLHTEQKRVARTAEGKLAWRGDDGDELAMAEGVDAFLKTPTGQRFLAPTGTQGAGSGPSQRQGGGSSGDAYAGESIMGLVAKVAQGSGAT